MGYEAVHKLLDYKLLVGDVEIGDFSEDDAYEFEFAEAAVTMKVGADGSPIISTTNNKSGTLKLTIHQDSDLNRHLQEKKNSHEVFTSTMKNRSRTVILIMDVCIVENMKTIAVGREAKGSQWTILVGIVSSGPYNPAPTTAAAGVGDTIRKAVGILEAIV